MGNNIMVMMKFTATYRLSICGFIKRNRFDILSLNTNKTMVALTDIINVGLNTYNGLNSSNMNIAADSVSGTYKYPYL